MKTKDLFGGMSELPTNESGRKLEDHRFRRPHEPTNFQAYREHNRLCTENGVSDGNKCKDCQFLYYVSYNKTFYKCENSKKQGSSRSTDWSSRWQACGLFKPENNQS